MSDDTIGVGPEWDPMVDPASDAEPEEDLAYLPGTSWRLWHAGIVVFVFLVSAIVGLLVLSVVTGRPVDEMTANEQLGILGPVQFVGGALGLWLVLVLYQKGLGPVQAFGLRIRARDSWAFFAGIGLQIGAALILLVLAQLLFPGGEPPEQTAVQLTSDLTGWGVAIGFVTVAVLAPVYEEALFRGLVLSRLVRLMTPWRAYLVNGLLFAGIHVIFDPNAWFASLALFPLGTALAWLAHRSGDISRAIFAHMGVNSLAAIGLFFADELEQWLEDLEQSTQAFASLLGLG